MCSLSSIWPSAIIKQEKSHSINIRTVSSKLWCIRILPGWSGQKSSIPWMVDVALPKRPINQFIKSRQQALRAYCSNIYTVWKVLLFAQRKQEQKKVELNPQYCSWPPTEAPYYSAQCMKLIISKETSSLRITFSLHTDYRCIKNCFQNSKCCFLIGGLFKMW